MTINIPLKAVAFIIYTLALLGGAFGISYAVFEWRDDDEGLNASALEERIDELEQGASASPTKAELDAQKCAAAIEAAGNVEPSGGFAGGSGPTIKIPRVITEALSRYCD